MTAEHLAALRRNSLGHLGLSAGPGAGSSEVSLREVPYLAQVNLRVDPSSSAVGRPAEVLGVPLPVAANTVATAGTRSVLWLGPDEWLVVGPDGDAPAIEAVLRGALAGGHGAVVDVSANRTTLELSGPAARDVLEQGCPIDLHPRVFGPGRCAQTLLARANVILHQVDGTPTYRIGVRRSFAEYLAEWLLDAMTEFGRSARLTHSPESRCHGESLHRR